MTDDSTAPFDTLSPFPSLFWISLAFPFFSRLILYTLPTPAEYSITLDLQDPNLNLPFLLLKLPKPLTLGFFYVRPMSLPRHGVPMTCYESPLPKSASSE